MLLIQNNTACIRPQSSCDDHLKYVCVCVCHPLLRGFLCLLRHTFGPVCRQFLPDARRRHYVRYRRHFAVLEHFEPNACSFRHFFWSNYNTYNAILIECEPLLHFHEIGLDGKHGLRTPDGAKPTQSRFFFGSGLVSIMKSTAARVSALCNVQRKQSAR